MNGHFVRFWNTIYISRSVKAFELRIETGKIAFQQMPGLVADIACKKITVNISGVIPLAFDIYRPYPARYRSAVHPIHYSH